MAKFAVRNVTAKTIGFDVLGVQYNLAAGAVQAFDSSNEEEVQAAIYPFGTDLVVDYSGAYLPRGGYSTFYGPITKTLSTLIAAVGAGDLGRNAIRTADGKITYFTNINAQVLEPVIVANGLNIGCDQTNGDGIELDWGIETLRSNSTYVALTDACYFKTQVTVDTVAGLDLVMGLRKAEAVRKDYNDYDEMAALRLRVGDLYTSTILNGNATVDTDTTDTVSDGDVIDLYLSHDHVTATTMICALANDVKAMLNLHLISSAAHVTLIDTTNTITAAGATDLATLYTLVNQMITKYDAHEGDAELAAAWVYHIAQEGANHSLAFTVPVATFRAALTMLQDMKTKINAHIADVTCHGATTTNISVTSVISCVFFKYAVNGGELSEPTVVSQFSFDAGEKVVPFIQYVHNATLGGKVVISEKDHNLL